MIPPGTELPTYIECLPPDGTLHTKGEGEGQGRGRDLDEAGAEDQPEVDAEDGGGSSGGWEGAAISYLCKRLGEIARGWQSLDDLLQSMDSDWRVRMLAD